MEIVKASISVVFLTYLEKYIPPETPEQKAELDEWERRKCGKVG